MGERDERERSTRERTISLQRSSADRLKSASRADCFAFGKSICVMEHRGLSASQEVNSSPVQGSPVTAMLRVVITH